MQSLSTKIYMCILKKKYLPQMFEDISIIQNKYDN